MINQTTTAPNRVNLDHLAVVLHQPRSPENIGAVARAIKNMGFSRLVLVRPLTLDRERMLKMATVGAATLIDHLEVFDDLPTALGPFQYIVGTTARLGGIRQGVLSPREMARQLIDYSPRNHIALLFGPENWGLTNQELTFCHALVNIPTAAFHSLNLAQAVLILAYEIFLARGGPAPRPTPRLANSWELESMYAILQETLVKINYIGHQNPAHWMRNVRRFFSRHGLKSREVQVIKGICRQINWYGCQGVESHNQSLKRGKHKEVKP
ncbi:MAG: rRNA methyltransferase [Desulfobacca sp. 4484_104]|nr:MAG: rRNA methyltransferase [Desulfobacca sp. 4484_104]